MIFDGIQLGLGLEFGLGLGIPYRVKLRVKFRVRFRVRLKFSKFWLNREMGRNNMFFYSKSLFNPNERFKPEPVQLKNFGQKEKFRQILSWKIRL